MVSISWRQGKKRYPKGEGEPMGYPVFETLKFELSYSLQCQSGNKKFIEMVLRKLESAFKMNIGNGDAYVRFLSMRQRNE